MTESQIKKKTLIRLSKGVTSIVELKLLVVIFENRYKTGGKTISALIEWKSFDEMQRRLSTSVFSPAGLSYPHGYRKYCIIGEYHNTKSFIKLIKKLIKIGQKGGDIRKPELYGQKDTGFKISTESLIHILVRHNVFINRFVNEDSYANGYSPSSFTFGAFAEPMLIMLMALNIIEKEDWIPAIKGKNLICNFRVGGQEYTLTRKGSSKEIISFYPRNDNQKLRYIELERNPNKMEFIRK